MARTSQAALPVNADWRAKFYRCPLESVRWERIRSPLSLGPTRARLVPRLAPFIVREAGEDRLHVHGWGC